MWPLGNDQPSHGLALGSGSSSHGTEDTGGRRVGAHLSGQTSHSPTQILVVPNWEKGQGVFGKVSWRGSRKRPVSWKRLKVYRLYYTLRYVI